VSSTVHSLSEYEGSGKIKVKDLHWYTQIVTECCIEEDLGFMLMKSEIQIKNNQMNMSVIFIS